MRAVCVRAADLSREFLQGSFWPELKAHTQVLAKMTKNDQRLTCVLSSQLIGLCNVVLTLVRYLFRLGNLLVSEDSKWIAGPFKIVPNFIT